MGLSVTELAVDGSSESDCAECAGAFFLFVACAIPSVSLCAALLDFRPPRKWRCGDILWELSSSYVEGGQQEAAQRIGERSSDLQLTHAFADQSEDCLLFLLKATFPFAQIAQGHGSLESHRCSKSHRITKSGTRNARTGA